MHKKIALYIIALILACSIMAAAQTTSTPVEAANSITPTYHIKLATEVEWTHLNPKRGDLAPKAGTLWGDRNGTEATGFLLKPSEGFKSPPHIHNVSYRGIVIQGFIHNDDSQAANMWMPAGSFWTQPKGEVHVTAALGANTLAYVEIDEGPYLVHPEDEHFDSGERPLNLDQSNIVWVEESQLRFIGTGSGKGTKVAFLWGELQANELNGTFLFLPPGFSGKIITNDAPFRAVIIKGEPQYHHPGLEKTSAMTPGSLFSSEKKSYHVLSNNNDTACIIYIRTTGTYQIN
ncbi:DUF4437 domain-containing protein [uncultured Draconibacterium sp.]|uniref:DUF4437 domain-containing protein n=1 Tax=uncultured Draconibacterium sp. TaxID=1573823 RepID=UPI0025D363EB|nr:DUF4437 domain-containing protein [uncultured Draconibacterium sp.]